MNPKSKREERSTVVKTMAAALVACWAGTSMAGVEGGSSTFYGQGAGAAANAESGNNVFAGRGAGMEVTTGTNNTFVGHTAGFSVTTGANNTFVGRSAGMLTTGQRNTVIGALAGAAGAFSDGNVFLGFGAGYGAIGSNKLYIDACPNALSCGQPLIYGEFDNRLLHLNGVVRATAFAMKSQLHFSVSGADEGGWLTSAGANNFFTSSGARYDAGAGGWIQRSADGKAVIAGSGAAGFRVLTSSGTAVGAVALPVDRLHIDYDGLVGVNTAPAAGRAINTSTGAYLSSGGVWTNASSRELKTNVRELSGERAISAFRALQPVTFEYKEGGRHVGFIAEDVPALVATADRKGLSPMDVVAVLTKVVQEQAAQLEAMQRRLRRLESQQDSARR